MLLGKRPRPPMKRTTSISDINLDLNTAPAPDAAAAADPGSNRHSRPVGVAVVDQSNKGVVGPTASSPRIQRRHSGGDFVETPDFLRSCSLCKRRLVPGRDIYMYRGDSAFCSLECRQQQMNRDEKKDKIFVASKKQVVVPPSGSQSTTTGETVAAS